MGRRNAASEAAVETVGGVERGGNAAAEDEAAAVGAVGAARRYVKGGRED